MSPANGIEFEILTTLAPEQVRDWNGFVKQSVHAHFFQTYEWGELQRHYAGREVHYWIGRSRGRLVLSALLLVKSAPLLHRSLYEIPCGPVFDDVSMFEQGLTYLDRYLASKAIGLDLNPRWLLSQSGPMMEKLRTLGFTEIPDPQHARYHNETLVVDLRPDPAAILQSFRDTTRHEITKAENAGVCVSFENSPAAMESFYGLYQAHVAARSGVAVPKSFFDLVSEKIFVDPEKGFVALATLEGAVLSAGVFFVNGKRAWYTYGASDISRKKVGPTSHLLHWQTMKHLKQRGCEIYDLGGALEQIDASDPTYGVVVFKRGFSKTFEKFLPDYRKVYHPWLMKMVEWKRRA